MSQTHMLNMLEEHNFLILTSLHVPKLRYSAHAQNINLSYIAKNHSSVTILKYSVYRWHMNTTAEFQLHNMIHN